MKGLGASPNGEASKPNAALARPLSTSPRLHSPRPPRDCTQAWAGPCTSHPGLFPRIPDE